MKRNYEKQKKVFNVIKDFIKENGYAPTCREIAKIVGIKSAGDVTKYLRRLRESGYITYKDGGGRTIIILESEVS